MSVATAVHPSTELPHVVAFGVFAPNLQVLHAILCC